MKKLLKSIKTVVKAVKDFFETASTTEIVCAVAVTTTLVLTPFVGSVPFIVALAGELCVSVPVLLSVLFATELASLITLVANA
ncbi:hypothetical protein KMW28_27280 [Flammeovirga yaeyamensis]|uniref:Uncharacterized protein n=1 Tax=Flammeovirga yaeyamensis TaxID=367791 RepID=A0AAX1NAL0_9BACT|nr:hypothetical protein [Flammeovirga yaeyamensis]MBB3700015.1 hypothetical protein [Flammeovirga yaeyamensis]NMF37547.1 hypothetical protein [Flammeovirga yaeyamensis]QWG04604.1 hypothetical protein KMW28_27280 [Flammeovirga yaeyamensis]